MKLTLKLICHFAIIILLFMTSCNHSNDRNEMRIVFLHHSTGLHLWNGDRSTPLSKMTNKISGRLSNIFRKKAQFPVLFNKCNKDFDKNYIIDKVTFPKDFTYGWHNYPYDYYNIWVKNAGNITFMEEPTLEILTKKYRVIILKHCFPVSNIQANRNIADINSNYKSLANYKLQYLALKEKFSEFPNTKFIVFTGAAQVKSQITEDEALRAHEFFKWVVNEWDQPDDNIFIWDLYQLQTEGTLYFIDKYSQSVYDSHPNDFFSGKASTLLFNRIIDVINSDGANTTLTGQKK